MNAIDQAIQTAADALAAVPPAPSRTDRYMARVEARLADLAQAEQRRFLLEQLDTWECRYGRFVATEGRSEPVTDPSDPPQAGDFLNTLCALRKRLGEVEPC